MFALDRGWRFASHACIPNRDMHAVKALDDSRSPRGISRYVQSSATPGQFAVGTGAGV